MAILKNEPLFAFKEGDYAKPHHVIVAGSDEEIGYDLGCLAKEKYDCTLGVLDDPIYGEARREFFRRNWPEMNERSRGIRRALTWRKTMISATPTVCPSTSTTVFGARHSNSAPVRARATY